MIEVKVYIYCCIIDPSLMSTDRIESTEGSDDDIASATSGGHACKILADELNDNTDRSESTEGSDDDIVSTTSGEHACKILADMN